jgi:hypothetical protein
MRLASRCFLLALLFGCAEPAAAPSSAVPAATASVALTVPPSAALPAPSAPPSGTPDEPEPLMPLPPVTVTYQIIAVENVPYVESTIRAQFYPRARRCYQRDLMKGGSGVAGKLIIQVDIHESGEVMSASVTTSTGLSTLMEHCVLNVARAMNFSSSPGGKLSLAITFTKG